MFGTKLRTWMEAHIVRSKKKKDRKKGSEKGFDSTCNSPRSHSANRSPALHQVHPVDSPTKNVNGIRLHGDGSYSGTVTTSSGTSGTSGGTGSVNLSSPESAYSTGYSTDGTSPGTSFPPEYYINIRTGTHYFQSNDNGRPQRPADAAGNGKLGDRTERTNLANMTGDEKQATRDFGTSTPDKSAEDTGNHRSRHSQQQQQQQQQQQTQHRQAQQENHRRRTGSFSADPTKTNGTGVPSSIPPPLVSPPVQSPRERSRIRTNPWLSANSSGSSTAGFKSRLALDESSGSSGLKLTESSGSASDVNANGTREGHARREYRQESLSAGRSPINHNWRLASGMDVRGKIGALGMQQRRPMSSSSGSNSNSNVSNGTNSAGSSPASSMTHSARSSEDDITLNEMMGKFDESYVYEKETDILSDSDPTDCEDYVDSLSDVDAGQDAGDENDPLENDDLDYIDNGSFLDLEDLECSTHIPNTGHCTYFTFGNELARRAGTRPRDSLTKRRNKDDTVPQRMVSVRNGAKRQSGRHKKPEEKQQGEKRKKRMSQRRKLNSEKCDDETANLNRVLVERMLLKNSGFNQGSRSVGGTPICLRRKKHDVNKNLSPTMPNDDRSTTPRPMTVVESEIVKRRSNSVSYVNGNVVSRQITGNAYMTTFASEIALIEADKEADRKYRELILEAENILVNMQKSQNNSSSAIVPSPSRKFHNGLANKRVELIKNTELNIELALSKSRNSQPELQSGSIRDLEHTSPKRQFFAQPCSPIHRFMERSSASGVGGGSNGGGCGSNSGFLPKETSYRQEQHQQQQQQQQGGGKCRSPDSPAVSRRTPPRQSPNRSLVRHPRPRIGADGSAESKEQQRGGPPRMTSANCNGISRTDVDVLPLLYAQSPFRSKAHAVLSRTESAAVSLFGNGRDNHHHRAFRTAKEDGTFATSSSSDSEERCDVGRRAPLMTFRSIDMGPIKETSSYCPQSEPVKRKVYAGSATYGRIQKTLGEHVMLRNSDGDTATDDTDDSRRSLKEKVALLRQERLAAEANANSQDSQTFQHQLSQLRRQMLMQTIEGLKRSLEDQSATLKQTCLESVLADCELP